jgi:hypothetical protein
MGLRLRLEVWLWREAALPSRGAASPRLPNISSPTPLPRWYTTPQVLSLLDTSSSKNCQRRCTNVLNVISRRRTRTHSLDTLACTAERSRTVVRTVPSAQPKKVSLDRLINRRHPNYSKFSSGSGMHCGSGDLRSFVALLRHSHDHTCTPKRRTFDSAHSNALGREAVPM